MHDIYNEIIVIDLFFLFFKVIQSGIKLFLDLESVQSTLEY